MFNAGSPATAAVVTSLTDHRRRHCCRLFFFQSCKRVMIGSAVATTDPSSVLIGVLNRSVFSVMI
ncbi:hypothetical protein MtrunA17_Chr6g0473301 [Medicago truncatula]|uniref:Uncharacterized protein n=1 Tax=Medicago truncatula TaxID=3880 RepID=A0A396HIZ8_MEDTR|nr:hypothetical protein MtrunA17_Chr6g0473301 [Medicago truncatula]